MSAHLQDPMLIYTIAFAIFVLLAWRYGRKSALSWVDGEIAKVRSQLDDAEKIRAEAEATLAEYKAKQVAAMRDAEDMIRGAKDEASRLKAQAEADLKTSLVRHEQQAAERIRLAEMQAIADVRQRAVDLAMQMARTTLAKDLSGDAASKLVDQAIAELPKTGDSKAKAA